VGRVSFRGVGDPEESVTWAGGHSEGSETPRNRLVSYWIRITTWIKLTSRGNLMRRTFYVYILANRNRRLYIGITNNLARRLFEHRAGIKTGFAHRYNIQRLVYWESTIDPRTAIAREKQLKGWRREKKINLIESMNPDWEDLSIGWGHEGSN
jgi:putative endonuclease